MSMHNFSSEKWEEALPMIDSIRYAEHPVASFSNPNPYEYDFKLATDTFNKLTVILHAYKLDWWHMTEMTTVQSSDQNSSAVELMMRFFDLTVAIGDMSVFVWKVEPQVFEHTDESGNITRFYGVMDCIHVAGHRIDTQKFLAMSELEHAMLLTRASQKESCY